MDNVQKQAETKTEVKTEVKIEKYKIRDRILEEGYFGEIEDRKFIVSPAKKDVMVDPSTGTKRNAITKYGTVLVPAPDTMEGTFDTGKNYFENLTPLDIHILVCAKVIDLNKAQGKVYNEWLKTFYKKKEED